MAEITPALIRDLREKTGAGMMDCKKSLEEAQGDPEKALEWLRKKGLSSAAKRSGKSAKEGRLETYVHSNSKIAVLVEVNCETDFVAINDEFKQFAKDIALHIAAESPLYLRREDVPAEVIEKEKDIARVAAKESGKPEKILEKIVEGKVEKYFQETCLLEQKFFRGDQPPTIQVMVAEKAAKMGENVQIARFVRFVLGETAPKGE